MNAEMVKLRASIAVTARTLRAAYEIENRSGEDIYVFDAMFRLDPGPVLDRALAYTLLEGDLLTLFRGVLRIPEGLQVEAPDLPMARLLAAGGALSSAIEATLPLEFHQPYEWNDRKETRTTNRVRLRIGYLESKDLETRPSSRTVSDTDVYSLRYRRVVDKQRFIETPVEDAVIQILVKP